MSSSCNRRQMANSSGDSQNRGGKSLEGRQFCNQNDDSDKEKVVDSKTLVLRRIDGEGSQAGCQFKRQ